MRYSKYFNVALLLRKFLFCLVLIVLQGYATLQLSIMIVQSLCVVCFVVYLNPYEMWIDNFLMTLSEVLMIAVYSIVLVLLHDDPDQDEQTRVNLGWAFITICLFIILTNGFYIIGVLVYNLIVYIIESLKYKKQ